MAKVKPHRKKPVLDMTPVVDLAFLLVTFFMLTAKFKPDEPVKVVTPKSTSDVTVKNENLLEITVSKDNKVFFTVDNKNTRYELITKLSDARKLNLTEDEKFTYSVMSSIGVPFDQLKSFLSTPAEERKKIEQPGIPSDSLNNELADWIMHTRTISALNGKLRYAIKGDQNSNYTTVKKVMDTFQSEQIKINQFHLITNLEKEN